jgi:hypothetical protein
MLGESEPGALGATHRAAIPAVEGKALAHGGGSLSPRHFFQYKLMCLLAIYQRKYK